MMHKSRSGSRTRCGSAEERLRPAVAEPGTRPRQPADQRYENTYIFGAVCPLRDTGAALILPRANTAAMQLHLDEIATHVATDAHALLLPTMPAGIGRKSSIGQETSRRSSYLLPLQSSTRRRISGSTCARTISRASSSRPTPTSSRRPPRPGTSSSPKPAASPQSPREIGSNGVNDTIYQRISDAASGSLR